MARWDGRTVVCVASGPSLLEADCKLVESSGLPVIAVNTSWKMVPFAEVVYAGDACWWDANHKEISISAERWTCSKTAATRHRINLFEASGSFNSGLRAIQLAIEFGASKIILLGYDCSVKSGIHWHGNHTKTKNPDAAKCHLWKAQFARLNRRGREIINCSRETALQCFPLKKLEEILC